MIDLELIARTDKEIADALDKELVRQQQHLELIASENFVSPAVMETVGSHLTNKYAEGYPGKRYYGGCEFVDIAETIAIQRACELFGAEHANVQPHSGAQANMAVFFATLQPGDTVLGMSLAHGGHLSHGSPVNMSGKYFHIVSYGVDKETERIDYDEVRRIAKEHRPKLVIAGASAYPRALDFAAFRSICDEVGALLLVDIAHIAGLVAAGLHQNPVPYADFVTTTTHKTLRGPRGGMILCKKEYAAAIDKAVFPGIQGGPLMHVIAAKAVCLKEALSPAFKTYQQQVVKNAAALANGLLEQGLKLVSGGTDNHLMLLDLRGQGITGKTLEKRMERANITANKNAVPFDPEKPFLTSGVRLGSPAVTSRGMQEEDMVRIAGMIGQLIREGDDAIDKVREQVLELCAAHPLYENLVRRP